MRLLLIANARASSVTQSKIRFIRRALASRAEVELVQTRRQRHATELARGAAADGTDVVAVLGGDGTINEVANGLAHSPVALGIIPGGGTNVLARSLGLPMDTVRAAGHLLARMGGPPRPIALGHALGRYFTFSCGVGLDGEIVRRVERRQGLKQAGGQGYFLWSTLRVGLMTYDLRAPRITLRWGPDLERVREGLALAVCQNTRPFTYLAGRPVDLCPRADVEAGLDAFAAGDLSRLRVVKLALQALTTRGHVRDPHTQSLHGQDRIEIACTEPLPVQMDGEFVGMHERVLCTSAPGALRVFA